MQGTPPRHLADSHVHLDQYPPRAVPGMVGRARVAGVTLLLNVGINIETSHRAANLARRYPEVLAAAGVHPRWLHREEPEAALAAIEHLVRSGQAAAIGEVGLDYAAETAPPLAQQAFFRACLDLACRLDAGVALHVVEAHADALRILADSMPVRAVVHYFQGDAALATRYLDAGCFISVGKPAARPENATLREAVRAIPLDRLLLETDSYPLPERSTEPCHVADVCRAVSQLRGESFETIAIATTANTRRLIGLASSKC